MKPYKKASKEALKQLEIAKTVQNLNMHSDQDIRIRCLELSSKIYGPYSAFTLISQSAALFNYVKTGNYALISGSQSKLIELERKYLSTIYDQIIGKGDETEEPSYNADQKTDIPNKPVSLFGSFLSRFRSKNSRG